MDCTCELGVPTLVPWLSRERRRSRPRTGPAAVRVVSGGIAAYEGCVPWQRHATRLRSRTWHLQAAATV